MSCPRGRVFVPGGRLAVLLAAVAALLGEQAGGADCGMDEGKPALRFGLRSFLDGAERWIAKMQLHANTTKEFLDQNVVIQLHQCSATSGMPHHLKAIVIVPPHEGINSQIQDFRKLEKLLLHKDDMNWESAKKHCESNNGHLAVPTSELEVMKDILRELESPARGSPKMAYLGMSNVATEGSLISVFGQPVENSGKEVFLPKDHCVAMNEDGILHAIPCNRSLPFFCQQPPQIHTEHKHDLSINVDNVIHIEGEN